MKYALLIVLVRFFVKPVRPSVHPYDLQYPRQNKLMIGYGTEPCGSLLFHWTC